MQLTVLRIVLAPVLFVLIILHEAGWAGMVFAIAAASDWWDGHIARSMGLVSALGAFLDPLADKLLTGAAFIAFAWLGFIPWWMVVVILARDMYMTYFRVVADAMGLSLRTTNFAKGKTFVQMTFIAMLLAALICATGTFGIALASLGQDIASGNVLSWAMAAVMLLTVSSALIYSYDNWPVLRATTMRYIFRRALPATQASPTIQALPTMRTGQEAI
jgi:CDP-diacylglycerol--glycerol-3-phosphate 3-phosphatidyltransferase